ncbi:hypothetical protein LINGRAHAP2_LOCUS5178 [Linum grandiflorum]
MLKSHFFNY